MAKNTISIGQAKDLLNYTIDNNLKLQEEGKMPIAICLQAEAGIGKTSIVQQIAQERGMTCTKLSLHELEEAGDITGYPAMTYECQMAKKVRDAEGNPKLQIMPGTVWLTAKQLDTVDKTMTVRQTGKTRMEYAIPAWVPEYNEKGNIFLLDDFGRCNPQLAQAVMELVLTQGYISWKLPKKTSIVLTSNPDNGEYNVNSLDEAQRTRFLNFDLAWDMDAWSDWAEKEKVDGRCINFVMSYSNELFQADAEGNRICNPRSFVMFANMISGVKDWEKPSNLEFINTVAKGCFKDEAGRFASMFTSFIRNKMHMLIQPKDMLLGSWDRVKNILETTLYDDLNDTDSYRPDIASLLSRRFTSFVNAWLESPEKTPISKVIDRLHDFVDNEEKTGRWIFNNDMYYHMIKNITSKHCAQTNKILADSKLAKLVV